MSRKKDPDQNRTPKVHAASSKAVPPPPLVRAIKGEGGMVIAQTPESTEFDGIPSPGGSLTPRMSHAAFEIIGSQAAPPAFSPLLPDAS